MPLDRSTRTLIAALLWVAAVFIIMNNIVGTAPADDWLLPLLFIAAGALVYWLPERSTDDLDVEPADTQARSDALATVGSPAPADLQDPVENMLTTPTKSLEETEEVASPPTAYIASPAPEINAPVTDASMPVTLTTPSAPAEPKSETPAVTVSPDQADTENEDTQERSDVIASVAETPAPAELQDPVDNMLTTPTKSLEETGEVSSPPGKSVSSAKEDSDNLTLIEGIGPKMAAALVAAGISTFAKLAATPEADLRSAISAAGMRFSPSLPTWPEQATYAARGDLEGLRTFQQTLTSGRKKMK